MGLITAACFWYLMCRCRYRENTRYNLVVRTPEGQLFHLLCSLSSKQTVCIAGLHQFHHFGYSRVTTCCLESMQLGREAALFRVPPLVVRWFPESCT